MTEEKIEQNALEILAQVGWEIVNGPTIGPDGTMERAFSAGTEPITPALHSAINRSGLEMMKRGAAITGSRRDLKTGGRLMACDL